MRAASIRIIGLLAISACSPVSAPSNTPAATTTQSSVATAWTISPDGVGPVHIGMTAAEAGTALGVPVEVGEALDDPQSCVEAAPKDARFAGLSFLTQQGRITYIALSTLENMPPLQFKTAEGVGLGSTGDAVKAAYPNAKREAQPYTGEPAYDLYVWRTPKSGMRFQVDEHGIVRTLFVGDDSISLMEGCA